MYHKKTIISVPISGSLVSIDELSEFFWCIQWRFSSFSLLVVFVNNETRQQSIHSDTVNCHKQS